MRLFLALIPLAFIACGDNDPSVTPDASQAADAPVTVDAPPDADTSPRAVTLQFTPTVGTAAFACGQTYASMGAEVTTISPRDFRLYVHDVKLVREDGERVALALDQDGVWQHQNVAMLDFEDFTGACQDGTPETRATITGMIPNAAYRGVEFTIGIPDALNHAELTTLPAPLNLTGLWWGWRSGHIFLAIVTHAEITTPAPATNDHYFHLGSLGCAGDPAMGQPANCAKPNRPLIQLAGFDPLTQPIIADFAAVLPMSRLATEVGCHSFTQEPCAWPFDLVGLNWFTGTQTPTTQKLFRTAP
jgi:uncharacterized repeat protein (TIGR04052 family)